jgi:NADH:ubiquinone oxidoreductase subunit F (NADH-binding)
VSHARIKRLLAGPPVGAGAESLDAHLARLGPIAAGVVRDIVPMLEAAGLLGRGGAGFPVGRKWRGVAERWTGTAVIVANGAEGEPASAKDRTLMAARPHLIIDGALLAAEAVGAGEIVFYVGGEHVAATRAMRAATEARATRAGPSMRLVQAPIGYVAGEATAAVHYINDADARPMHTPPRMSQAGVGGRPTLVQNVESLAYAALIARFGDRWYATAGRDGCPGTALVTIGGPAGSAVREIELGTTLAEAVEDVTPGASIGAVVLGGYFGTWARARDVWDLPLDPAAMQRAGVTFGCGMIGLLPAETCGVEATARIMSFMASASAGQCGPCVHGLRSIGDAVARIAAGRARGTDLVDLERWTGLVTGRGACRHPDGAAQLMVSALDVFAADFAWHARSGRCSVRVDRAAAAIA